MFARLLVPTDFSAASDAALEYARTIARTFGGSVRLLHVLEHNFLRPVGGDPLVCEAAALKQLRERLTDEDYHVLHATTTLERSDEPWTEIVSCARSGAADLIVMGTHGRSGMAHLLVGSVAEKVVRTAPCPVLTVRRAPRATTAGFTRILVPTDFSPPSDSALDDAWQLAVRFGASVHLLHVLEDPQIDGPFGSEVFVVEAPNTRAARLRDARERLAHRVTARHRDRLHATTEVVFGATARTVVDYATDYEFDLIVMGTHGRTGVAHLLMGSVAERVVRSAPCPVMTTRQACVRASVAVPGAEDAMAIA